MKEECLPGIGRTFLFYHCLHFLVQRPPVVKEAPIVVSLTRNIHAISKAPAGFSLNPSLAVAVLRILDVLARVEQCFTIEAVVDISCMRNIAPRNDPHETIVLPNPHLPPICGTGSSGYARLCRLSQQALDPLV